jgi:enoyl-CoA hydratase/carnithine racemase
LDLLLALENTLSDIAGDSTARVVVLAAAGSVFSSGHDLSEMVGRDEECYRALFSQCVKTMQRIRTIPQPVIARVQGIATAAGCQLAASCDLIVAGEDVTFATPGVKIGLFCTTPMVPLVRGIPAKVAMEMLLTGQPLTARRAYELGFVNRVVSADQLDETIRKLADSMIASSAETLSLGKAAFYDQLALDEPSAYDRAVPIITSNAMQQNAQEGISAFLEKRQPKWRGDV